MDFVFKCVNKVDLGVKLKCQFWQMTLVCGEGTTLQDTFFLTWMEITFHRVSLQVISAWLVIVYSNSLEI